MPSPIITNKNSISQPKMLFRKPQAQAQPQGLQERLWAQSSAATSALNS